VDSPCSPTRHMGPLVRLMQVALRLGFSQQKSFLFGRPSVEDGVLFRRPVHEQLCELP
jgi:hypothetical protein